MRIRVAGAGVVALSLAIPMAFAPGEVSGSARDYAVISNLHGDVMVGVDSGGEVVGSGEFDPVLGRFASRDSFAGRTGSPLSANRYAYGDGDPLGRWDPTGFSAEPVKLTLTNTPTTKWVPTGPPPPKTGWLSVLKTVAVFSLSMGAGYGCGTIGGPALASMCGGATYRGLDTLANGGSAGDALGAAIDLRAALVDGTLGLATMGVAKLAAPLMKSGSSAMSRFVLGAATELTTGATIDFGMTLAGGGSIDEAFDAATNLGRRGVDFAIGGVAGLSTNRSSRTKPSTLDDLSPPPPHRPATEAASPWSLGPSPRGFAIEETLGGNLPRSFPTIDSFANGTATSIKSIDLTASTYQSAGRLTSRLNGYVDSVAGFDGAVFDGVRIAPGATTARELVVAVQPGVASSAQQAALSQAVRYGASNGVTVRVVSVP